MEIGKLIKEIRLKRNLTQTELGERIGVLKSYISKIESGHQIPRLEQLEKFSKALGVDPHFLIMQTVNIEDLLIEDEELKEKIVDKYVEIFKLMDDAYFNSAEPITEPESLGQPCG